MRRALSNRVRSTLSQALIWQLTLDLSRHQTPLVLLFVHVSCIKKARTNKMLQCVQSLAGEVVFSLLVAIFRVLHCDVISGVVQP